MINPAPTSRSVKLDLLVTEGLHQHGRDDQTRQGVIDADDFFQGVATSSPTPTGRSSGFACGYRPSTNEPTIRRNVLLPMSMAQTFDAGGKTAATVKTRTAATITRCQSRRDPRRPSAGFPGSLVSAPALLQSPVAPASVQAGIRRAARPRSRPSTAARRSSRHREASAPHGRSILRSVNCNR